MRLAGLPTGPEDLLDAALAGLAVACCAVWVSWHAPEVSPPCLFWVVAIVCVSLWTLRESR